VNNLAGITCSTFARNLFLLHLYFSFCHFLCNQNCLYVNINFDTNIYLIGILYNGLNKSRVEHNLNRILGIISSVFCLANLCQFATLKKKRLGESYKGFSLKKISEVAIIQIAICRLISSISHQNITRIFLMSCLICNQIWLSPIVNDHQPTHQTNVFLKPFIIR